MVAATFPVALAFVWRPGFDDPRDGYHVTAGDCGGGTLGGVIEATWANAVRLRRVCGTLACATDAQLSTVLHDGFWGAAGDGLPAGLDLMVFNGRMMTGAYAGLLQSCLGFTGGDVDGDVGTRTLAEAADRDVRTLICALHGVHYAYLRRLAGWPSFRGGWTRRLCDARTAALALTVSGALLS